MARRVILRTLRAMQVKGVAVYAEADLSSLHVREADEALRGGVFRQKAVAGMDSAGAALQRGGNDLLYHQIGLARLRNSCEPSA
jgi:urea carboxylase